MWKLYSQRVKDNSREIGKHFQMNKVKNPTSPPPLGTQKERCLRENVPCKSLHKKDFSNQELARELLGGEAHSLLWQSP
jgi:hypothetical protein